MENMPLLQDFLVVFQLPGDIYHMYHFIVHKDLFSFGLHSFPVCIDASTSQLPIDLSILTDKNQKICHSLLSTGAFYLFLLSFLFFFTTFLCI